MENICKLAQEQGFKEQLDKDFIDHFVLGIPIGYRIDKDGNMTRLSNEELQELKSREENERKTN